MAEQANNRSAFEPSPVVVGFKPWPCGEHTMNRPAAREALLGRVREALAKPTDPHVRQVAGEPEAVVAEGLPGVGQERDTWLARFQRLSAILRTECHVLNNEAALPGALAALADDCGWQRIAAESPLLETLAAAGLLDKTQALPGVDKHALAGCDVGITGCQALVAQTGSIMLTSNQPGGRALSVLPPHHVVVARREQLIGTLKEAYVQLQSRYAAEGRPLPSMVNVTTGPSRTGDIERKLVLGAHGPKRLTVFVC